MIALILFVLFGIMVAFFATENTQLASITIAGQTLQNISVFAIVMASLLFGILLSWLISILNSISTESTLKEKQSDLKRAMGTIDSLRQKNRELEAEVLNLNKKVKQTEIRAYEQLKEKKGPSFIDNLKYRFNRKYHVTDSN